MGKNFWEENAEATKAAAKEIGKTTYVVRVHFSKISKETMNEKIKRLLKNEIQDLMNAG